MRTTLGRGRSKSLKEVRNAVFAATGMRFPADPFVLAWCCGLRRRPRANRDPVLRGRDIYYDYKRTTEQQLTDVARELSRWALRWRGASDDDRSVSALAWMLTARR
jgi:hypothetical protein